MFDTLPGELLGVGLQRLEEILVAHHVAQHAHDGGALAAGERPQFGRVIFQARGLNDGHGIDGQRFHHHVAQLRLHRRGAFFVFAPQEFGIGGQSVGEPQVIARGGRDQFLEPLAGHLVGQQLGVDLFADAARGQENHARGGKAVGRAFLGLHDGEIGVGRQAEHAGEIRHGLTDLLAVRLRHFRFRTAEIEGGGDAFTGHARRLTLHDGDAAGKGGAIELNLVARLVADGFLAIVAAAQHGIAHRHGDVQVGGEAVGGVAADREPARRDTSGTRSRDEWRRT